MSENSDEKWDEVKRRTSLSDGKEGDVEERTHFVDDDDEGDDSEVDERNRPFKRRRRKRARTASERLKWDERVDSLEEEGKEDAQGSSPSPPSPSRTTTDNPQSDSDSSDEEEDRERLPRAKRRRRRKKVVLRPVVPGAPRNSTSFIIDSHVDVAGLYYDFSSPTPASQRCDYFQHMQESFESEYTSARAGELEQMSRDDLVGRIVQLEQRENELRKIMETYDPALMEHHLHDTLIAEQEENRRLKSQLTKGEENPFVSDEDEVESGSSGEQSTSSSTTSSSSSARSTSSKTNSK